VFVKIAIFVLGLVAASLIGARVMRDDQADRQSHDRLLAYFAHGDLSKPFDPSKPVAPPQKPEFGWRRGQEKAVSFNLGERKALSLREGKFKIAIESESAVSIGVFPTAWLTRFDPSRSIPFETSSCAENDVLRTDVVCEINDSDMSFVIEDSRGVGTAALGVLGLLRNSAATERAAKPNIVKMTFFEWSCIKNCPNSPSTAEPK
jgi:hypothetical protein